MFPCLSLVIFCLNFIQMFQRINGTRCYTCQTGPERIICSIQTECTGSACYVIMDGKNNVAGCTSSIDPTTRIVGCFNETSTRKVCACYTNFCNTPVGTLSLVSLPFSPLTTNISAPWDVPVTTTTSLPSTTTTTLPSTTTTQASTTSALTSTILPSSTTTIPTTVSSTTLSTTIMPTTVITTTRIPSTAISTFPSSTTTVIISTTPSSVQTTTKNSSQTLQSFNISSLIIILIGINKLIFY